MHPFNDDLVLSKESTRYGTVSAVLVFMLLILTLLADDSPNNTVFLAVFYGSTALATALAIHRGWTIGSRSYEMQYGTYRDPSLNSWELLWRVCLIYGLVTYACSVLFNIGAAHPILTLLVLFLDVAACIGFALYFGEKLGWEDADVVSIDQEQRF